MDDTFDYIVVGAGSAGAALAARLSEKGKLRILLLEAGGEDSSIWFHLPLGVGKLLQDPRYVWPYSSTPQSHMNGQRIYSPRGRALGGSSSINGMAYVWGDPAIFDSWSAEGITGWSYADVQPYFKRMEANAFTDQPGRGREGPVQITDLKKRNPDRLSDAYLKGWSEIGVAETPDYNAVSYEGARYLEQTGSHGRRYSTSVAYLRAARKRANLRIETSAHATRLLIKEGRCTGVVFQQNGERRTAYARAEVLLSGGTIQTPQLLELSGIGQAARLRALGIDVILNNPEVGENLSDHLQVRRTYQTRYPQTINDIMRSPYYKAKAGLRYLLTRKGILSSTGSTSHAITRSDPSLDKADVMVRLYLFSGKDRYSRSKAAGMDNFSGFSIGGFLLSPKSRGSVHITSADPMQAPDLDPNYLDHPDDVAGNLRMLRLIDRLARTKALSQVIIREDQPALEAEDDEGLCAYMRRTGQTAWHTVGSCRMGQAGRSVVDSRLRVHGIDGLRIIDASVFPTIPSSNTNAAAIMIGERGADLVLADL